MENQNRQIPEAKRVLAAVRDLPKRDLPTLLIQGELATGRS